MALVEAPQRSTQERNAADAVIAVCSALRQPAGDLASGAREHGETTTWIANEPPDAVVFPQATEEVQEIVRLCARHRVPVVAFGTGTSLEGQVNAPRGGICLDFRDMNRVLAVHPEDLDCVIEPGITRKALNEHLRDSGLFFPIDPGADASLGGMAATRASGTNAVRYGTMKDNVLALKAVLASGEVVTTARRAKKSSAGYDLTRLMVGSEGTLGIITELTLRLSGIPEAIASGVCPSLGRGGVQRRHPHHPVRHPGGAHRTFGCAAGAGEQSLLEAVAAGSADAVRRVSRHRGERRRAVAALRRDCEDRGGGPFDWAVRAEDRSRLWQARHDAYWAAQRLRPGVQALSSDVCVPISRLAECVGESQRDAAASRLLAPVVGHVGDGNFHMLLLIDRNDADEVRRAEEFLARLAERAVAMDGTCTGEHGIGQGKMKYLLAEHGAPALQTMRAIKRALDPLDILNPGKIFSV